MVSKCANPECSTPFQYFREGKLFQVDVGGLGGATPAAPQLAAGKKLHRVEHYWLCGACSAKLTLAYEPATGVVTVPLKVHAVRRAAAS
jgi:hypothetical protein